MERILLKKLERLRIVMNELAEIKGIEDPQVLRLSQEIDRIHNQLNRLYMESAEEQNVFLTRFQQRDDDRVKEKSSVFYAKPFAARVI